ncbi:hypothetical protein ANCDUO_13434 [Ancylostoma duodenale]|uniref:Uncharacterized protein n=1 Tax=Ancylostoma duodenale TaxID=51022 RepID=A0A0C2G5Z8_9BILA|nr:hypothetical protein ANCDUO_13434 [Ancylostoma duodenale]
MLLVFRSTSSSECAFCSALINCITVSRNMYLSYSE